MAAAGAFDDFGGTGVGGDVLDGGMDVDLGRCSEGEEPKENADECGLQDTPMRDVLTYNRKHGLGDSGGAREVDRMGEASALLPVLVLVTVMMELHG